MHVNKLTKAIYEVRGAVEVEMHAADPENTLETPLLLSLLKVELSTHMMDTWMKEFDDISHELGKFSIDFSKLTMAELYVV